MVTAAPRATAREWTGLAVLALPTLVIALSMTVLHLAVPELSAALRPSSTQLLWIIDVYGFMISGLLIAMGTVGDRIGRRRLLTIGGGAFGLASATAAFAPTAEALIAARALMGVTAATLMPATMSLIRTMFQDPRQRAVAVSVWISCFTGGAALGPVLGGALLERFWWGSVFLPAVPVAALLVLAGPRLLPEDRDRRPGDIDPASVALLLAAILTVVYGLKQSAAHGVAAVPSLAVLLGLSVGTVFVLRQRALTVPLLDLRLFANRSFGTALGTLALVIAAMSGIQFFVGQYLQTVVGLSPLQAGLVMVPNALAGIAGTMLAPVLARRIAPARLMAAGLLCAAAGLALFARVGPDSGYGLVIAAGTVMSVGFGPTLALGNDLILGMVPARQSGEASAIAETGADLGVALGIAFIGGAGLAVYRADLAAHPPAGVPASALEAARDTVGGAFATAGELPGRTGDALREAAALAFTHGMRLTATIGLTVALTLTLVAAFLLSPSTESTESAGLRPESDG
ncbi:MFS transporter [Actinocorallia aurea]